MKYACRTPWYREINVFDLAGDAFRYFVSRDAERAHILAERTKMIRRQTDFLKKSPIAAGPSLIKTIFEGYTLTVTPVLRDRVNYENGVSRRLINNFEAARKEFDQTFNLFNGHWSDLKFDESQVEYPNLEPRFKNSGHIPESLS